MKSIPRPGGNAVIFRPWRPTTDGARVSSHGDLSSAFSEGDARLVDLDLRMAEVIARHLDVDTPVRRSSEVPLREDPGCRDKNGRIIDICHFHGASILYDGASAAEFIDLERFRRAGLEVVFQNYHHPVYPQRWSGFESHLSAVDLIMNVGRDAPEVLRSSPLPEALGGCGSPRGTD